MGWWITLGILVLLAIIPIGVSVRYNEDGALIKVIAGFVRFTVFPKKKKKPRKEKKPNRTEAPAPDAGQQTEERAAQKAPVKKEVPKKPEKPGEKKGGSLLDFIPLVQIGLKLIGELFSRTIHMDVLEVNLVMGGGDPCDLAVNYGKAWAALGNLWPCLTRMFTIKKRDVKLQCDFTASQTLVTARVDITVTLGRLLSALVRYGVKALAAFLKIRKKRKAAPAVQANAN